MEYLDLGTKYTKLNDNISYVNRSEFSSGDQVYKWVGFPLVMVLLAAGTIVNILLIIATRNSPRLKAPIFQLLFAIAFADILLLAGFSLPEISYQMNNRQWIFGSKGCTLIVFLQFLPTHVTSCLIVVCCWERFYAVCRPHSALWITSRIMSGIIIITWLVNAGLLAPLLAMTREVTLQYPKDDAGEIPTAQSCQLDMQPHIKKLYFTVMGGIFYAITAIVSIAFLACTVCKARKIDLEEYFVKDDFKNHIVKCTAVVTIISILFWLPYRYVYFYHLHSPVDSSSTMDDNGVIVLLGTVMVIFGGAVKPIVYITASSQFRKSIFRALKCCKSNDNDFEQTHGYKMSDQMNISEGPLLT